MKIIGMKHSEREVGRSTFKNHIIRFVRALSDSAKVEVVIDMWKVEGQQFSDVKTATQFAESYIENQLNA